MRKNIAILMADLSGYTDRTETHGSFAAADLIDKYIGIVENCLVGDSRLHQRTGAEIVIVSASPNYLLATALISRSRCQIWNWFNSGEISNLRNICL
jgi:adenylate cyclase